MNHLSKMLFLAMLSMFILSCGEGTTSNESENLTTDTDINGQSQDESINAEDPNVTYTTPAIFAEEMCKCFQPVFEMKEAFLKAHNADNTEELKLLYEEHKKRMWANRDCMKKIETEKGTLDEEGQKELNTIMSESCPEITEFFTALRKIPHPL